MAESLAFTEQIDLYCCNISLFMQDKRHEEIKHVDEFTGILDRIKLSVQPLTNMITSVNAKKSGDIARLATLDACRFMESLFTIRDDKLDTGKGGIRKLADGIEFKQLSSSATVMCVTNID